MLQQEYQVAEQSSLVQLDARKQNFCGGDLLYLNANVPIGLELNDSAKRHVEHVGESTSARQTLDRNVGKTNSTKNIQIENEFWISLQKNDQKQKQIDDQESNF